jgi:Fe-S oxidoreductase/FAD/FMN-containing dehydrogenase
MKAEQQAYLKERFDSRVSFDGTERRLYGHDIAEIPTLVKPLIGSSVPDAVVQPETEGELIELVRWAREQGVPLTPRGRATSGYGGALPIKKGVVVDFYRMRRLISVDLDAQAVTVEAGAVWETLDRELARNDLTLRLYPTSYPSATVGGWLAQGGGGIGSYEYGYFSDNVVSARLVLPTGEVREFSGHDLNLVADAEGITGLISQVTLRVRSLEDLDTVALACRDAHSLQNIATHIVESGLPIWSLVFINPRMAEMKNQIPVPEHRGQPTREDVRLPLAYVVTLTFRARDGARIRAALPEMAERFQAEILDDHVAQHEWEQRFNLLMVKRLGPSLVPAEVVVPLAALGDTMTEIESQVSQPLVKEGVIIRQGARGEPEAVILGFIPADQRKFSYNFVFGLALTIMKIAQRHGGRPYATGLYFARKAQEVLGKERVNRLRAFKAQIDAQDVLNPGKVIGSQPISVALSLANALEPLIRPLGNRVIPRIGERPTKAVRGIPADVAWYAYSCSQCGYCVDECDQFYGRGWESQSPRGKWYWLREYMEGRAEWDQGAVGTFLACTTCELCNLRCPEALPIELSWMKLRGLLIREEKRMTIPPFEMMAMALQKEGDIWAGYRRDRSSWFPEDLWKTHGPDHAASSVYFAGCTASYVEQDIAQATVRLLDEAGVDFTYLGPEESCCALPMLVAGKWDLFVETMKRNIRAVKEVGAETVISSCPACDMMWRQVYPIWAKKAGIEYGITARHYSEVVAERLKAGELGFPDIGLQPVTVTFHDSCHIGRASGIYEPPRDLIKAMPNVKLVEMSHSRQEAHCCGSVLTLIKDPPVAADIGEGRLHEAMDAGAEKVVALCPCCQFQLRVSADKKRVPMEVLDLARFASTALGYDFPDPNPEVRAQWAVFEAMIHLMTPQGFAELMGTLWPEVIDAMPFGMGRMMRLMGKVPGTLELMKPLFPVLFPRLLPMMMPKVMPAMMDRIAERVPMPDYMREQMPELMPEVMANLMPHMIGDVVPLVTQPMIDYLRSENGTEG